MSTKWCIQNCVIYFGNRKIYCRITKIPKHYTFDRSFSSASSNTTVITQTLHILWNEAVECGWMCYSRRFSWSSIWRPPALILLRVESVTGISGVLNVFCVKYLIDWPFFRFTNIWLLFNQYLHRKKILDERKKSSTLW